MKKVMMTKDGTERHEREHFLCRVKESDEYCHNLLFSKGNVYCPNMESINMLPIEYYFN
jgi:hypothetical protein